MGFRDTIKNAIAQKGLTQTDVCIMIDRPTKWLNSVLREKKVLTVESALDISLALDLDAYDLLCQQALEDIQEARKAYTKQLIPLPEKEKTRPDTLINRNRDVILELDAKGVKSKAIAKMLGLKHNSVWTALHKWKREATEQA